MSIVLYVYHIMSTPYVNQSCHSPYSTYTSTLGYPLLDNREYHRYSAMKIPKVLASLGRFDVVGKIPGRGLARLGEAAAETSGAGDG
jgi:hypothetical protein